MSLTPFMSLSDEILNLPSESNWRRANRFCEKTHTDRNWLFDYIRLWENGKIDILRENLREKFPPIEELSLNSRLGVYMRLHGVLIGVVSDLLPNDWINDKNTFGKIRELIDMHMEETLAFVKLFEENGELRSLEHRLIASIEVFFHLVDGILPAYLVIDSPTLRDNIDDYAMSTVSFEQLLDFYQKSYETILDAALVLIALNNIYYRNNFDILPGKKKKSFMECRKRSNKYLKVKDNFVETECFSELIESFPRNKVRNSIGHFATIFDGVQQRIKFINTYEGEIQEETLTLLEFAILCIENFYTLVYLLEIIYQLKKLYLIEVEGESILLVANVLPDVQRKMKKVGRNEPCSCGSGKNINNVVVGDEFVD